MAKNSTNGSEFWCYISDCGYIPYEAPKLPVSNFRKRLTITLTINSGNMKFMLSSTPKRSSSKIYEKYLLCVEGNVRYAVFKIYL